MKPLTLPNFMLIGAAKCGTTSLHYYLQQHRQIFLPAAKEAHFFDWDDLYQKGLEFYVKTFFTGADQYPMRGDATPMYFHMPDKVIPRIQRELAAERLKYIVIFRDPVKRAWSHYLHMVRIGEETLSFNDALDAEAERRKTQPQRWYGYFHDGLYAEQLEPWLTAFPQQQFCFLLLDDLQKDPAAAMRVVFDFLGVNPDVDVIDFSRQNEAGEARNRLLMRALAGNYPGAGLGRRLIPPLVRRRVRVALRGINTRPATGPVPAVDPAVAAALRAAYRPSMVRLESMLGQRLPNWYEPSQGGLPAHIRPEQSIWPE